MHEALDHGHHLHVAIDHALRRLALEIVVPGRLAGDLPHVRVLRRHLRSAAGGPGLRPIPHVIDAGVVVPLLDDVGFPDLAPARLPVHRRIEGTGDEAQVAVARLPDGGEDAAQA